MKRVLIASTLVMTILTIATPAEARVVVVDRASARGDFAIAVASGNVDSPNALFVKVKSRPTGQRVDVFWNVVCSRGSGAGSRDGDFSGQTSIRRQVRMPYANPDSCTFAASAQLSDGSGRIVVILQARV
jgi:hypothetical protein